MSELQVLRCRSGELTARLGSRRLHSAIDPRSEAARFVERSHDSSSLVVVIGPGLGYALAELRRQSPEARIVALSLSRELAARLVAPPDSHWIAGGPEPLARFLDREIADLDAASVLVLEWAPVTGAFAREAATVRESVASRLRRAQASLFTQGATGRRWLRNRVHNYLYATVVRRDAGPPTIRAVVVVAAGPSLEEALPPLLRERESLEFWVTGSALDASLARGLVPDLVVVTDANTYATEHLRAVAAGPLGDVPVAAPLSATRGVAACRRVLVFSEGDADDEALLARGDAAAVVPPHGTVTATAMMLARALSPAPIVLVGADFAWRSGRSHARPHLSEQYRREAADRLIPESTALYAAPGEVRVGGEWTTNRTLTTYAAWFNAEAPRRAGPLYVATPSPTLASITPLHPADLERMPAGHPRSAWSRAPWPDRDERRRRARAYLRGGRRLVADAGEPERRDTPARYHDVVRLASQLALPELLRWYRRDGGWSAVAERVATELDSCEATLG